MTASTHSATCHCGSVTLTATLPEGLSSATRCTCSFCRRRAAPAVTALTSALKVTKGAEHLTLYTWGSHTAKHYFCKICGIYMYHQRRSDPAQCGVNLGCIDGAAPWTHEPIPYTLSLIHI